MGVLHKSIQQPSQSEISRATGSVPSGARRNNHRKAAQEDFVKLGECFIVSAGAAQRDVHKRRSQGLRYFVRPHLRRMRPLLEATDEAAVEAAFEVAAEAAAPATAVSWAAPAGRSTVSHWAHFPRKRPCINNNASC